MTKNYIPWLLQGTPMPVQVEALKRGFDQPGFGYWLEQGLGKSATVLSEYMRLRGTVVDALVILCPNSLKSNWAEQLVIWGADARAWVWGGPSWGKVKDPDVFIFNYEATLQMGGDYLQDILRSRRCMFVLDEAHRAKNPNSNTSKRIIGNFGKDAHIKRSLTGTPMTLTPLDFFPQFRFMGHLDGWNPVAFRNRFMQMGGHMGKQFVKLHNADELQEMIGKWAFRATKAEWAKDLPLKTYKEPIRLEMPKELRRHYQTMLEEFVVMVNDADPDDVVMAKMVASQYLKLQQISSGFIYDGDAVHRLYPTKDLPKFKALMDVIDANGNTSKTLVFAHFRPSCTELIDRIAEETGRPPAFLIGGMKDHEISAQRDAFNSSTGPQVMVLQLSAGKEGHTLLGDQKGGNPCHTVCYYENNFNANDRDQSEDRAHRYGQRNPVMYVDFVSSPMEAMVIRAYQRKKNLIQYLLDNIGTLDRPAALE